MFYRLVAGTSPACWWKPCSLRNVREASAGVLSLVHGAPVLAVALGPALLACDLGLALRALAHRAAEAVRQQIADTIIPEQNGIDRFLYVWCGKDERLLRHLPAIFAPPLAGPSSAPVDLRSSAPTAEVIHLHPKR